MIARGCVRADGTKVAKAGALLSANAGIEIDDPGSSYVSRAALKLIAGLDAAGFDASGSNALDLSEQGRGAYFLTLSTDKGTIAKRVIVE